MQDTEVIKAKQHAKPQQSTIIPGRTASIPTSLALLLGGTMAELTSEHIKRVETKLNTHAVHYIQHLYRARRAAEKGVTQEAAMGSGQGRDRAADQPSQRGPRQPSHLH